MKYFPSFLMLFMLFAWIGASAQSKKTTLDIEQGWIFKPSDNPENAKVKINEQDWKTIDATKEWEKQGYESLDGIAWYRKKIVIPASLKKEANHVQALKLMLGHIDDNDITYFNGKEIGRSTGRGKVRSYPIPFELIKFGKENVIAVRVEDISGNGGLFKSLVPRGIRAIELTNIVSLTTKEPQTNLSKPAALNTQRTIQFKFGQPAQRIPAKLTIKVENLTSRKTVSTQTHDINVGKAADSTFVYPINISEPGAYFSTYTFVDNQGKDTITHRDIVAYIPVARTNERLVSPQLKPTVIPQMDALAYEKVKLSGYLQDRMVSNLNNRLLKIDETGILECFYNRPGNQTWVGEYAGKYLHAAARAWRYSHDAQLKAQMDRIVDVLIASQLPDGYLGTYLPENYWTAWDVWAHKYDLLGLLSYYTATGYQPALESSIKIGDLLCNKFGKKPGQLDIIEAGYHVGMAPTSVLEPMADLYLMTGDKKYLDFCRYILEAYEQPNGPKIISTLNATGRVDKVGNAKAYEMMSNFTGMAKLYQITGDTQLLQTMQTAWNDVATNRLYITGSASKGEHFQDNGVFPAERTDRIGEGCVSTTWIQFSQVMYEITGESKYMDEIEKTIYNHLLGAQNPLNGCVSYYTALQGSKPYRCNIHGHCCLASVPRAVAEIPALAFAKHHDHGFAVNLYNAGQVTDEIKTKDGKTLPIQFSLHGQYPMDNKIRVNIMAPQKAIYRLSLRVPAWSKNFKAQIKNETFTGKAGEYLTIERMWDNNTDVNISFDHNTQVLDGGKSYPNHVAIKHGPQILVVDDTLNEIIKDWNLVRLPTQNAKVEPISGKLPAGWFGADAYKIQGKYDGKPVEYTLVPFAEAGQNGGTVRTWVRKEE